jgi:iron complex transport system substrate-binding protein
MRFLSLFSLFFLFSCGQESVDTSEAISESTGSIEIEYAENLLLETTDEGYKVSILNPNSGSIEKTYTVKSGEKKKIIGLTSTLNGMLSILGETDLLVGVSSMDYVYDADIRKKFERNEITEFGDETNHSVEKIIASDANTILYSGFGDEFPNHEKLEKLGFSIMPIYDWREIHPLGKAEWIKLVGILAGKEKEAIAFFEEVKQKYEATKSLLVDTKENPSVISGNLIGDIWYAPAGESYMARVIQDAGGDYIYAKTEGTGSTQKSIEQIIKDNRATDFWINPGIGTKRQIEKINPHCKHLDAFSNGLYCYSPNTSKFWERSAAEPHLVLSDLIHIFHPEIEGIKTLHFYEQIH